jgi:hypothetical protein
VSPIVEIDNRTVRYSRGRYLSRENCTVRYRMVALERRSHHSLTGNAHESAAHCSSCAARVRSWPWMISLPISRSVVSHERPQCPLPPRHDRSFSDRKGSLPSGRFSRGYPLHTPHEVQGERHVPQGLHWQLRWLRRYPADRSPAGAGRRARSANALFFPAPPRPAGTSRPVDAHRSYTTGDRGRSPRERSRH